jgi:hypothetical protein
MGTINVDVWRRFLPSVGAALITCWIVSPLEVAQKAYKADLKYPEHLRRNYKSSFDALIKLPFQEGPSMLFKNSLPAILGTFLETWGLFYFTDYFLDYARFLHFDSGVPYALGKSTAIGIGTFIACLMCYPAKHNVRNMVELFPSQVGIDKHQGQYRKAMILASGRKYFSSNYHGFANYLWIRGPRLFVFMYVAELLGLFRSWRTSYLSFPGINPYSDIHG